ncbi:MAG: hypothetical protein J6E41_10780, partial [Lachnospiraceae bacterium]|nr:hypothetical protein [Lachnospiraceae bacterium]
PAGNGPEGETGTTVRYQKTGGFLKPEGALIPPPKDAVQHRMGVEVHGWLRILTVRRAKKLWLSGDQRSSDSQENKEAVTVWRSKMQ